MARLKSSDPRHRQVTISLTAGETDDLILRAQEAGKWSAVYARRQFAILL